MDDIVLLCMSINLHSRLANHIKLDELKAKEKGGDKEMINRKNLGEGDLFGVRALEGGYFGGVAQSRPSSPTTSYVLSPQTVVTDLGNPENQGGSLSASSSNFDLHGAGLSVAKKGRKPSPLRLQDAMDVSRSPPNPSASSVGGVGGSYMPPDGRLSPKGLEPETQKAGWVSPLDVHFSRPQTLKASSTRTTLRPHSFLPRLNFPADGSGPQSEVGSIIGSEVSQYTIKSEPKYEERSDTKTTTMVVWIHSPTRSPASPSESIYHQYIPSRGGRDTSRSMFPASPNRQRSSSRSRSIKDGITSRSLTSPTTQIPPVPLTPPLAGSSRSSIENGSSGDEQAVIRDSVTRAQRVSISHQPEPNPENSTTPKQATIIASQSVYQNPFVGHKGDSEATGRISERTRSRSTSVSTSRSSTSLSRTRDSIRRSSPAHARKASSERSNRHSRDRDQLHYDPTSRHRSRAGSVQGRAVDFDHPRESPFSNSNAIPSISANHSTSSSISSFESAKQNHNPLPTSKHLPSPARGHGLPVPPQGTTHLVVTPGGRGRSGSEGSQASISDFYDSYYRQSRVIASVSSYNTTISSRQGSATLDTSDPHTSLSSNNSSAYPLIEPLKQETNSSPLPSQPPTPPRRSSRRSSQASSEGNLSAVNHGFNFTMGRKAPPLPLNLRPLEVGETIIEMPTPKSGLPSPMKVSGRKNEDRFPSRN
jgi:hypothetical protein